jgi:DNA helicase-2/ATP-dependent DNA helicase PcrA
MPPLDLSTLNERQLQAVQHPGGALLVFAGAGSGKTRVITYRIARLVSEGIYPTSILAVTFTNKTAREMRDRIEGLIGEMAKGLWMGTFHSICGRMLRENGRHIGIERNFVIYDDDDQLSVIKNILKQLRIDDKSLVPRRVLNEISRAKERLIEPEKFAEEVGGVISKIYTHYQARLRQANALDFDDMLLYTVRMLRERPDVLEHYAGKFRHVLVDEFQDVNHAQYTLVQMLSSVHGNITVVGDDDQSIYAWRGADVQLIHKFAREYPNATTIKLEQNYRSTKRILAAANAVIRHNVDRASKELYTENPEGAHVRLIERGDYQDEALFVADAISSAVRAGKRKYADFAVLYRTNAQSRAFEEGFMMMRIPHALIGGIRFYERKEIKDLIAYMRLAANPDDDVSLRRVINEPARGIGPGTLQKAQDFAEGQPLWNAFSDTRFIFSLPKKAAASVSEFVDTIKNAAELAQKEMRAEPVLIRLMNDSGYLDMLRAERSEEANSRLDNLQELVNVAIQHDVTSDEPGLLSFLQEIALFSDQDQLDEESQAEGKVTLMTAHTAKGLEFPAVFIVGLEEGVFPHSRSLTSDSEIAEERRLCYVAMTRAREELTLTYAARRTTYGQSNFNPPSRFLSALPHDIVVREESTLPRSPRDLPRITTTRNGPYQVSTPTRPLRSPDWKPPFEPGQQVKHGKFGIGVVVSCMPTTGDCEVTVMFPGEVGTKKLMANIAKLEAV